MNDDTRAKRWGDGRVFPRGRRWWIAFYDKGAGKEMREPGGDTEHKALKKLKERLTEVRGGQYITGADRLTVNNLFDALEVHLATKGAKSTSHRSHIAVMRKHFGTDRAVAISADRLERFVQEELASGEEVACKAKAPATVNRELGVLRQAYRLAVKQRRLPMHAVPYFPMLPERNARQGFFEQAEFEAVVAHLPRYAADVLRFAYLTGWRRGEIVGLYWSSVDRAAREIRLGDSKNGEGRVLAYDDEVAALLDERWTAREVTNPKTKETSLSPRVFHRNGKPVGDFRKVWIKALEKAGLPTAKGARKLFHDTRRTAVRNLVRAGVSQPVAMSISGHKTVSMFLRYKITSGDEQREALRRVRDHLQAGAERAKVVPIKKAGT